MYCSRAASTSGPFGVGFVTAVKTKVKAIFSCGAISALITFSSVIVISSTYLTMAFTVVWFQRFLARASIKLGRTNTKRFFALFP